MKTVSDKPWLKPLVLIAVVLGMLPVVTVARDGRESEARQKPASTARARIFGHVRDFDGKPIEGADIELKTARFENAAETRSAKDGSFSITVETGLYMALAAVKHAIQEFNGDPDRVYLTGLSMGGHGTWYLAYRYAELFAAAAPICGWVRDEDLPRFRGSDPVVPADAGEAMPALARRLAEMPIWIFHGEMDATVPVVASRAAADALKAASADVRYTEYLGLDHNSWDATYASDEFVRWLFAQRRR